MRFAGPGERTSIGETFFANVRAVLPIADGATPRHISPSSVDGVAMLVTRNPARRLPERDAPDNNGR